MTEKVLSKLIMVKYLISCLLTCLTVFDFARQLLENENDVFSVSDTEAYSENENPSPPNSSRTYDLPITSSDALPLRYRRLVGAKAIKLGSQTSCILLGFECRCVAYAQ